MYGVWIAPEVVFAKLSSKTQLSNVIYLAEICAAPPLPVVYPLTNFKFVNFELAPPELIFNITVEPFPSNVAPDDEVNVNLLSSEIVSEEPPETNVPLSSIVSPLLALFIAL